MEVFKKEENEALQLLALLYAKRRFIIIFTIVTTIVATLVSLFVIPEKFTSEAVIYPTPSNSQDAIIENPSFGFEGHSNQLLQVLKSNTLRERLIDQFDLATYYEIDTTRIDWYSHLSKKMEKDIEFERTPYYSLSITATTTSPELSAKIVNYIVDEVNVIVQEIFMENIEKTHLAYRDEYIEKKAYVRTLLDSLIYLKQFNADQALDHLNAQVKLTQEEIEHLRQRLETLKESNRIYAYHEQVSLLSNQVANASARYNQSRGEYNELKEVLKPNDTTLLKLKGDMAGARKNADTAQVQLAKLQAVKSEYAELELFLNRAMDRYANLKGRREELENAYEPTIHSAGLTKLQTELEFSQEQLQELKARYERAQKKVENKLPSIYVISRGRPMYKKSSPSNSKNLLLGFGIGLIFSSGWVLLKARWQRIKPQLENLNQ